PVGQRREPGQHHVPRPYPPAAPDHHRVAVPQPWRHRGAGDQHALEGAGHGARVPAERRDRACGYDHPRVGSAVTRSPNPRRRRSPMRLHRLLAPRTVAHAHCDLPCGVYDPAQARIEAESVKAIQEKYQANEDPVFRTRAILIKEQRADLVKHHLWVLWTDYFKPPHFEKYPQLHELFNKATKQAGAAGGKGSMDPAEGQKLLDYIAEIDRIFWETKAAA